MKVKIDRERLLRAMEVAADTAPRTSTNPLLANALLSADKAGVAVRATDLEIETTSIIADAEVSKPGRILADAALLRNLLRECQAATIDLSLDGAALRVGAGFDMFELTTADPGDFPKPPELKNPPSCQVASADLARGLRATQDCVAKEKGRYALNGIFIEPRKGALDVIGTDGRRLARVVIASNSKKPLDYQVILPRRAAGLLARLLPAAEKTDLQFSETRVIAQVGTASIAANLVYGLYPDYRSVLPPIPKDIPPVIVAREQMLRALNRARLLTSVESQAVRFELSRNHMTLRSRAPARGQGDVKLEVEYTGPDMVLGYDPHYVIQALNTFESDKVQLAVTDKDTGTTIHAGDPDAQMYLVMPIDI